MSEFDLSRRILIVAAHPDDEVIGAGALMAKMRDVHVAHATGGSPVALHDAHRHGFSTAAAYAAARRDELLAALALAGIGEERLHELGFVDQQTSHRMCEFACEVRALLQRLRPQLVITHPYEGGHPDHDATALAVRLAAGESGPELWEMTSYYELDGTFFRGRFLPNGGEEQVFALTEEESMRKRRMFACFRTQWTILDQFPVTEERFRRAPVYRFSAPPHEGTLHYDHFWWGIHSEEWRRNAARALREMARDC